MKHQTVLAYGRLAQAAVDVPDFPSQLALWLNNQIVVNGFSCPHLRFQFAPTSSDTNATKWIVGEAKMVKLSFPPEMTLAINFKGLISAMVKEAKQLGYQCLSADDAIEIWDGLVDEADGDEDRAMAVLMVATNLAKTSRSPFVQIRDAWKAGVNLTQDQEQMLRRIEKGFQDGKLN